MSACEGGYFEFVFSYILFSSPTRESRGVLSITAERHNIINYGVHYN